MNVSSLQTSRFRTRRNARRRSAAAIAALVVALLAGCGGGGGGGSGGKVAAPNFGQLSIPDPSGSNQWIQFATINPPPAEVLPTRGRAVRFWFTAPAGSVFNVSLRDLTGATVATLNQNSGGQPPPEAGYFEILSENTNQNPAIFNMHVRAPLALTDQANYDILVVHQSARSDMSDSDPMVVSLRQRKIFKVTVSVTGNGHVVSTPSGIECGTSRGTDISPGRTLTDCSNDFGPGQITLSAIENNAITGDPNAPKTVLFLEWTGNCAGTNKACVLTLDGTARSVANATFVATGSSATASTGSAAPTVPGWRWIGIPGCGPIDMLPGVTVHNDAQGYFCCSTGSPSSSRCSGQKETAAACTNQPNQGINARLIQPGGCYEVDSFP